MPDHDKLLFCNLTSNHHLPHLVKTLFLLFFFPNMVKKAPNKVKY